MWHGPGRFPGGADRALLTQHEDAVIQVFGTKTALSVFEGDFVSGVVDRFAPPGDPPPAYFRFPAPRGAAEGQPLVVGGDAAVLLNDSQGAADLLAFLTEPDTFAPWMAAGGFLVPNRSAHAAHPYKEDLQRKLADELLNATEPRFDLSDLLSGTLGGADGQGSWRFLQDFFLAATRPGARRDHVVAEVTARFSDAARDYEGSKGLDRHACS
jgi:alpha-glucoside transport system substrate-binding protein